MFEVQLSSMDPSRFRSVLTPERYEAFGRAMDSGRELLAGRVVWNINSTARGGGVAELLESLVPYARGADVDVRWLVMEGTPEFFAITKRIHNRLHGSAGDGGPLDDHARAIYEQAAAANLPELTERVRPGDVVIVHDPQPAGLIRPMVDLGAAVIWRCHVGLDHPNDLAREAWRFLARDVEPADAYVFSRESFVWEGLDRDKIAVIPPSIDVFSPKNQDLDADTVLAVLRAAGILGDGQPGAEPSTYTREDGSPGRVDRQAELFEDQRLRADISLVVQISRWDALKDPLGVIRGFADHVPERTGAHLVYAGPSVTSVTDDPEGADVLRASLALRESLDEGARRRVHLAQLPMEDPEENAIMVNALQRHARVVSQKSLAEGFGLTVAEAMWKARPVVASGIGGIRTQIEDGRSGILLDDPRDLQAFGGAITGLLEDPERAERMGQRARERVRDEFTSPRSLLDYLRVIGRVLERVRPPPRRHAASAATPPRSGARARR
jgi:trehalose synthase